MNYQFELKSSQLYMVLGGMVAVGLLLFLVGVIVGADSAASRPKTVDSARDTSVEPESPADARTDTKLSDADPSVAEAEAPLAGPPLPTEPGDQPRIYEIQLSAHLEKDSAAPVIEDLTANNFEPYVVETRDSRNRTLFTVRIGPWDSMAQAAEAARTFRRYPDLGAYEPVIRHRPKPLTSSGSADG